MLDAQQFFSTVDRLDRFLGSLVRAQEAKQQTAQRHSTRVGELARAVGPVFGFSGGALDDLFRAALVHDIGKIGIPDAILDKPGPLTAAERDAMRAHALIGADLVAPLARSKSLVPAIRHHHEWWDGTGYPDGLAGTDIPLAPRIIAVCDSWDAMTCDRPYRQALGAQHAAVELRDGAGVQWDPAVVNAFLANVLGGAAPRPGGNQALPAVALTAVSA